MLFSYHRDWSSQRQSDNENNSHWQVQPRVLLMHEFRCEELNNGCYYSVPQLKGVSVRAA